MVGTFAVAPDGLWIGFGGKLGRLDFNLTTNLVMQLPIDPATPITCLCRTPSDMWVGTQGDGLIGCNFASRQCVHLAEKDGLLMDFISSLCLAGDTLWIGYGGPSGGGLGKLDLATRRPTSFSASIAGGQGGQGMPPRVAVNGIACAGEDVWCVAQFLLRRYQSQIGQWETPPDFGHTSALERSADKLFLGMGPYGSFRGAEPASLGLRTMSLKDGQWKAFPAVPGLPTSVTCLTADGANVWVGGPSYIALVDPAQEKVLKFAYVRARSVEQIQAGGGCVWAQCEKHLYKGLLTGSR